MRNCFAPSRGGPLCCSLSRTMARHTAIVAVCKVSAVCKRIKGAGIMYLEMLGPAWLLHAGMELRAKTRYTSR